MMLEHLRPAHTFPFLTGAALALAGCSTNFHQNEGAVQMGHVLTDAHITSVFIKAPTTTPQTDPLPIKNGEAISVKLIAAYICDFRESRTLPEMFSHTNAGATPCKGGDGDFGFFNASRYTPGEIVILANAGERSATAGLTFNAEAMQRNSRVVYYNEDVRESGQLINALNIPVYGPKTYEGGTFFMDLAVMELDNEENQQNRQLLQALAKIGSVAYAPGTPVLNLLNTLGGALLGANGDDVEMRYQMEFDPIYTGQTLETTGSPMAVSTSRAPLREGYYAVIRKEQRDSLPEFDAITVTEASHNPYLTKAGAMYTGGSWLLLRVSREDHAQARAQDISSKLSDVLSPSGQTEAERLTELETALTAFKNARAAAPAKP